MIGRGRPVLKLEGGIAVAPQPSHAEDGRLGLPAGGRRAPIARGMAGELRQVLCGIVSSDEVTALETYLQSVGFLQGEGS